MAKIKQKRVISLTQEFLNIFYYPLKGAGWVGANVLDPKYTAWQISTITTIFAIFLFHLGTFFGIYNSLVKESDWGQVLTLLCFWGGGLQGSYKLKVAIAEKETWRYLYHTLVAYYRAFEKESEPFKQCLRDMLNLSRRTTFSLLYFYSSLMVAFLCVPIYYRVVYKRYITVLQIDVPGLDETVDRDYIILQVIHTLFLLLGMTGNCATDFFLFLLVSHLLLLRNIFKCRFDELNAIVEEHPQQMDKSFPKLKQIMSLHQEYIHYCNTIRISFFWIIFVEIAAATFAIIFSIVTIFMGTFASGPVYMLFQFMLMYAYSFLGNLIELSNEDVMWTIYHSNWFLLTPLEQKNVMMMLRKSQNQEGLSIGGVAPLSLSSALQLTKSIYSIAMLMNESMG